MPFSFQPLEIPDVILVEPRVFADDRGFFLETFKSSQFAAAGIPETFVQGNHSFSTHGVLRGLHYQIAPQAQGKLVTAVTGEVFDVAVDIRPDSPTYARWVGVTLSGQNHHALYIPPGFAHGFCVLSDQANVTYMVTAEYASALDRGVIWNDSQIGVKWPIADPILSPKDAQLPSLRDATREEG